MFEDVIDFIRETYQSSEIIPLHRPLFVGNEKKYIEECIDSSYVSSVGKFVDEFEQNFASYTGAKYAVATTNGTAALHTALILGNVKPNDEVITQPLTFVATCNAITYCEASPVFIDVEKDTMGLSPVALENFLESNAVFDGIRCINKYSGKAIKACIAMHTFGHPCRIDRIRELCDQYNIFLIEDSAESVGSLFKDKHTGTYGHVGIMSFNGNKIITAGGGGCVVTNDLNLAKKAKHITTTSKVPHSWNFIHDMIGYNYRMPNLNAALLLAQLENIDDFVAKKRALASKYDEFFRIQDECIFFTEPNKSRSNYWLNSVIFKNTITKNLFLEQTNLQGVRTRPVWTLMHKLKMFSNCFAGDLKNSEWIESRVVCIPSSVIS